MWSVLKVGEDRGVGWGGVNCGNLEEGSGGRDFP